MTRSNTRNYDLQNLSRQKYANAPSSSILLKPLLATSASIIDLRTPESSHISPLPLSCSISSFDPKLYTSSSRTYTTRHSHRRSNDRVLTLELYHRSKPAPTPRVWESIWIHAPSTLTTYCTRLPQYVHTYSKHNCAGAAKGWRATCGVDTVLRLYACSAAL